MKKTYIKPKIETVVVIGPRVLLGGSNTVNSYENGDDINIGDSDWPSSLNKKVHGEISVHFLY